MRLDLDLIETTDVRFGPRTVIEKGVLSINRDELIRELEQEPLFERVEIELAHPGESCRVIRVLDVVEPRCRLDGPNFPGALDSMGLVGSGLTRVLKNVAVVETSEDEARARSIIDMCGPATHYSPIGDKHLVVLLPRPVAGADRNDFRLAVKKAGLRAATFLAAACFASRTLTFDFAFSEGGTQRRQVVHIVPQRESATLRFVSSAASTAPVRTALAPSAMEGTLITGRTRPRPTSLPRTGTSGSCGNCFARISTCAFAA